MQTSSRKRAKHLKYFRMIQLSVGRNTIYIFHHLDAIFYANMKLHVVRRE